MKRIPEEEYKKIGIDILLAVHEFCEKRNLKYVLFYGTLLGAIRHDGYIPWDDDIDIAMPREDYETFIRDFDTTDYGVKSCFVDKGYYLPWAKVYDKKTIKREPIYVSKHFEIGFNIDVFPIDGLSSENNYWSIKKSEYGLIRKLTIGNSIIETKKNFKNFFKKIVQFFYSRFTNYYSKKIDRFFIHRDKTDIKTVLISNEVHYGVKTVKYVFPLDMFENRILHRFESVLFYIPNCYDQVLNTCYGDYHKLPPLEKRQSHHTFITFYK